MDLGSFFPCFLKIERGCYSAISFAAVGYPNP